MASLYDDSMSRFRDWVHDPHHKYRRPEGDALRALPEDFTREQARRAILDYRVSREVFTIQEVLLGHRLLRGMTFGDMLWYAASGAPIAYLTLHIGFRVQEVSQDEVRWHHFLTDSLAHLESHITWAGWTDSRIDQEGYWEWLKDTFTDWSIANMDQGAAILYVDGRTPLAVTCEVFRRFPLWPGSPVYAEGLYMDSGRNTRRIQFRGIWGVPKLPGVKEHPYYEQE